MKKLTIIFLSICLNLTANAMPELIKEFTQAEWGSNSNNFLTACAQIMTGREWVDDTDKASAMWQMNFSYDGGGVFAYAISKQGGYVNEDDLDDFGKVRFLFRVHYSSKYIDFRILIIDNQ